MSTKNSKPIHVVKDAEAETAVLAEKAQIEKEREEKETTATVTKAVDSYVDIYKAIQVYKRRGLYVEYEQKRAAFEAKQAAELQAFNIEQLAMTSQLVELESELSEYRAIIETMATKLPLPPSKKERSLIELLPQMPDGVRMLDLSVKRRAMTTSCLPAILDDLFPQLRDAGLVKAPSVSAVQTAVKDGKLTSSAANYIPAPVPLEAQERGVHYTVTVTVGEVSEEKKGGKK